MARKSKKDVDIEKNSPSPEENNTPVEETSQQLLSEEEEYNQLKQQLLEAYEQQEQLENAKKDEDTSTDTDYSSLKQKLSEEYNNNKNLSSNAQEEDPQTTETEHEDLSTAQEMEDETEHEDLSTTEKMGEENEHEDPYTTEEIEDDHEKYKYDIEEDADDEDSELEIEDVSQSSNQNNLEAPKELTEKQKDISPDIDQGVSKVAISKGSNLAMMVALGVVLIFVIYKVLQPSSEELATRVKSEIDKNIPISKPIPDSGQTIVVPEIPKLPTVPTIVAPTPPPAPTPPVPPVLDLSIPSPPPPAAPKPAAITPPPPASTSTAAISSIVGGDNKLDQAAEQRKKAKMNSAMLIGGGGGGGAKNVNPEGQSLNSLRRNTNQIVATYIGDLRRIIGQGKVIDAVLETAINTDLPGTLRAVVSRDVYSESAKNVLIPRGSRLVGTYNTSVTFGISRVQIAWTRVIRPDGIDVQIASPGIDNLGRTGTEGKVDNHILRNLSTALMVSALDISLATYLDKNTNSSDGTTTTVTGGVTTTGGSSSTGVVVSPTTTTGTTPTNSQTAAASSLQTVEDAGKQLLAKTMAMPPTITVDQGTPLKVYVQRDILFPGSSANLTKVIE